jgi:hypothetical protein
MQAGIQQAIFNNVPRFDARLIEGGNQYINPFTGRVGSREIGTHVPLEKPYQF